MDYINVKIVVSGEYQQDIVNELKNKNLLKTKIKMNYELAKKLKDAGFPQNTEKDFGYSKKEGKYILNYSPSEDYKEFVSAPTLSELIEACGEEFGELRQSQLQYAENKRWKATSQYPINLDLFHVLEAVGSTPEEAVANLWLKLNEKTHKS